MTILTQQNPKHSINMNHDLNQDASSTTDMIFSENGTSSIRQLNNVKMIAASAIIVTVLMGFFLLSAIYIQSASKQCNCSFGSPMNSEQNQNSPYFEPLKALSSETSKEIRNFPLKIHMNDPKSFLNNDHSGRVSCEVTRKTASQVIATEPKEMQTPYGNVTTDPKLLHLTGEKLVFTCYNGEKPKPVVLIARPRIFAIFSSRRSKTDANSTETEENSSSENASNESASKDEKPSVVLSKIESKTESSNPLVRNKRDTTKQEQMECTCTCPVKKN